MAKLSTLREPIKAIVAADSGAGKTGMLASLAQAGFNLRIFDADKGTPILGSILKDHPEALDRIEVNSFTNKTKTNSDGWMEPVGMPRAWTGILKSLNAWPDDPKQSMQSWGPDTVAVFDSLTMMGRHALLNAQYVEGRQKWKPELQHYGVAMAQIEALFAANYGDNVQCHVLYLTHVKQQFREVPTGDGNKTVEELVGAFPSSLGQGLNAILPRYVNDILTIKVVGQGNMAKRYLSTKPTANAIMTKTREIGMKSEYLLADGSKSAHGLAEYFADCGWPGPAA